MNFVHSQVEHPAAKMLVMASQQQEQECGDGTNFVLILAGALLENAEELIRMVCKPFYVTSLVLFCSISFCFMKRKTRLLSPRLMSKI